ncbi:BTAD domain-containing putative transcriptional regulator [Novosphingobium ginsenosidimutans]|uniref:BTAD domain-containing putative transcriptional regulator n=1 Tax=Novosphingobium ginsenosidimutans TaxID=1176536 RepID=UPI0013763969|nr:BTAD domain-containing putative transcriptional regulator [Novosphingobium ginsenosidimutans]
MPLAPAASTLAIRLIGSTRASFDGADLPLPASRKTRAILAYLLLADRPVSRQQLCELFFDVPDDPRAALRWSLSKLRGVLEADGVERVRTQRDQVSIDTAGLWVDALALRSLPHDLGSLDAVALAAVLGWSPEPLLADADLPNRPDYAAWLVAERHRAQAVLALVLTALAERQEDNPAAQIEPLQRLIALDPLDAAAYQRLIAVLVELGRRSDAEALAGQAERALAQNGIDPGAALRQPLRRRIDTSVAAVDPAPPLPERASAAPVVAVLPVVDLSMEPLPGHVTDGFFEGLVHALSRFQSLVTIAGASTSRMRGVIDDPVEIARRLGADILVGGSLIATRDGTLRFRWRAIDGQTARIVTSGELEGHCDDVWDLQEAAARVVAVEVEPRAQAEALRARAACPTASASAYDHYLRGVVAAFRADPRDFGTALDHFEQAIALDPRFHPALALAPWAASYANRIRTPAERDHYAAMSRAALRHGADDARTLATAGGALCYMARDHAAAWQAVNRAITINPNEHTAWSTGGWMHAMNGDAAEAHRMFDRSSRLNPLASNALGLTAGRAMAELLAGSAEQAEAYVIEALDGSESHPSALMTGVATAALLGLAQLEQRRAALLRLYPEGIDSQSIRHLPFERPECQERYFAALRLGGVPG